MKHCTFMKKIMFLKKYKKFSKKFDKTTNILMQYEKIIKEIENFRKKCKFIKKLLFPKNLKNLWKNIKMSMKP